MMVNQTRGAGSIRLGPAFTLVEMITVLAIVAMLAAMTIPRLGNSIARQRADASARRIAADLRLARAHALQVSASQTVTFDSSSDSYALEGMQDLDHPDASYQVELSEDPYSATLLAANFGGDAKVIFDIYGVPDTGGSVTIEVGDWMRTVTLEADTGNVTVQ